MIIVDPASSQSAKTPPFLKWAGGKRWLASVGVPRPASFERLVEPFAGSAAVFFALSPKRALLSDINDDLINLYQVIKNYPNEIDRLLTLHHRRHSKDYYYRIRSTNFKNSVSRAARMLYLNRTCWNGLYRVNIKGQFNVPIGTKTNVKYQNEDFHVYSSKLSNAKIVCQDFEKTIDQCGAGDFIFVDPPYTVKHNMNGFVKYNEKIFSWEDQERLSQALRRAGRRGAAVLVTNADHDSVIELYRGDFEYDSCSRHSVLAGSASHRGQTTEAIFKLNF